LTGRDEAATSFLPATVRATVVRQPRRGGGWWTTVEEGAVVRAGLWRPIIARPRQEAGHGGRTTWADEPQCRWAIILGNMPPACPAVADAGFYRRRRTFVGYAAGLPGGT